MGVFKANTIENCFKNVKGEKIIPGDDFSIKEENSFAEMINDPTLLAEIDESMKNDKLLETPNIETLIETFKENNDKQINQDEKIGEKADRIKIEEAVKALRLLKNFFSQHDKLMEMILRIQENLKNPFIK